MSAAEPIVETLELQRIAPGRMAKFCGAIYTALGGLFAPLFLLSLFLEAEMAPGANGAPFWMYLILGLGVPILYGLIGFLGGGLMALLYNLFARWIGGLRFTTTRTPA